jgi:G3E family GTPase
MTPGPPVAARPIPTLVIAGFLGAGKTTLLRGWLAERPAHERWGVLVNEFGALGVDRALIEGGADRAAPPGAGRGAADDPVAIVEIAGGCACCAAQVALRTALTRLLRRGPWDRLIVETTGLGHPAELVDRLRTRPFDGLLDVLPAVAVVDATRAALYLDPTRSGHDRALGQLELSRLLVINRANEAGSDTAAKLAARLAERPPWPRATIATSSGRVPLAAVLAALGADGGGPTPAPARGRRRPRIRAWRAADRAARSEGSPPPVRPRPRCRRRCGRRARSTGPRRPDGAGRPARSSTGRPSRRRWSGWPHREERFGPAACCVPRVCSVPRGPGTGGSGSMDAATGPRPRGERTTVWKCLSSGRSTPRWWNGSSGRRPRQDEWCRSDGCAGGPTPVGRRSTIIGAGYEPAAGPPTLAPISSRGNAMNMIYNSPNYCVVEFKSPEGESFSGGYEIMDKTARREIFLGGRARREVPLRRDPADRHRALDRGGGRFPEQLRGADAAAAGAALKPSATP